MRTRNLVLLAVIVALFGTLAGTSEPVVAESHEPPPLSVLRPGEEGSFFAPMPVNIVFVGYEFGPGDQQVDGGQFASGLAPISLGVLRSPTMAQGCCRLANVNWQFDYRLLSATPAFEDAFFGFLAENGREAPLTHYQETYNEETVRSLDIDSNLEIDAGMTEEWLAENGPALLGVDTSQPTVFLVNWFGRPDFRFHVYVEGGATDPDTGFDFGADEERSLMAWGGTAMADSAAPSRVWFHDLSAGPNHITRNWDLTTPDVDGSGLTDYRLPPVWEYGNVDGYRPFDDLSGDLSKIVRYVAINLLFAPSPLYDPLISAPDLPSDIDITINSFIRPGAPNMPMQPSVITQAVERLQPWNTFTVTEGDHALRGNIERVRGCFLSALADPLLIGRSCYGQRAGGIAFYDLLLYWFDRRIQLMNAAAEHSVPVMVFEAEGDVPFVGMAANDYRDGSQAYVLAQLPRVGSKLGFSSLIVHEVGHYLGLSHPHDGVDFDPDTNTFSDLVATGDFHFMTSGHQVASVMSYANLSGDFSQFELDSMARWLTVGYINQSNHVLEAIYESSKARQEDAAVVAADQAAAAAVSAYLSTDYQVAASHAKSAFEGLLAAASRLRIPIEPQAPQADLKAQSPNPFFADPLNPMAGHPPGRSEELGSIAPALPGSPLGWHYR